ncbi:hypothetical protein ACP70R_009616 [Stipagrostis hirtigluma subsp. patula]
MANAGEAGGGGTGRTPRLPRWTRQEILVLIEGKRMVERSGRGRGRGRGRGVVGGGGGEGEGEGGGAAAAAEPTKWAAVAEYCRRHGVDRGAVQCRKRWSNLAGDYKKIREWERGCSALAAAGKEAPPSFWAMRNDARRERRLPGFFDREVYDILEGRGGGGGGGGRGHTGANAAAARLDLEDVEGKAKEKAVLDSGQGARAGGGGLFSSSSEEDDDEDGDAATPASMPTPAPAVVAAPISEKKSEVPRQDSSEQGTSKSKQPEKTTEDSPAQGGRKRQRSGDDSDVPGRAATDLQGQLIEILDRSGRMVAAQLEAQNINSQLDREQRKDQVSSLLGVLGKVADALYRIADKM